MSTGEPLEERELSLRFRQAAEAISSAGALLFTAGAGMGVDSGLPDFRGNQGFWKAYPTFESRQLSFVDLANPQWFFDDPAQAWGFYGHRYLLYQKTEPHAGFQILKSWAERLSLPMFVFTSNVDGHFERAGFHPDQIVECHGSINHMQCTYGCSNDIWEADGLSLQIDDENLRAIGELPRCKYCDGVARPNVLMFGDGMWLPVRSAKQESRYAMWLNSLSDKNLVVVECGAGTAVPTVRMESEQRADQLIRINPREPQTTRRLDISIPMPALAALEAIDQLLTA